MFTKDLLKNKRILITGGGTGLGKEMASHFAEYGADIYICGRRDNVLQDTAEEIKEKLCDLDEGNKNLSSLKTAPTLISSGRSAFLNSLLTNSEVSKISASITSYSPFKIV